jgi:hypothetical protein
VHFPADYFRNDVLEETQRNRLTDTEENDRRSLVLHLDNAKFHTARCTDVYFPENQMKRALHPAFSPGLSPSDFNLFGKLKNIWKKCTFKDENELVLGVSSFKV